MSSCGIQPASDRSANLFQRTAGGRTPARIPAVYVLLLPLYMPIKLAYIRTVIIKFNARHVPRTLPKRNVLFPVWEKRSGSSAFQERKRRKRGFMKVRTNRMRIYADPVHAETELTRQKRSPAQRHPSFLQQSREIPAEGLEQFAYRECPAYTLLYQFSPKDTGQSKVK